MGRMCVAPGDATQKPRMGVLTVNERVPDEAVVDGIGESKAAKS